MPFLRKRRDQFKSTLKPTESTGNWDRNSHPTWTGGRVTALKQRVWPKLSGSKHFQAKKAPRTQPIACIMDVVSHGSVKVARTTGTGSVQ